MTAIKGRTFGVLEDFEVEVLLDLEYSVLLGEDDRFQLLLLLLAFDEEVVVLLFFFASSASRAGAKDFTTAFKVLLSVIEDSSAVGKKRTSCISTPTDLKANCLLHCNERSYLKT